MLAILLVLSTMLLHGQEWNVLGLPAGTYGAISVASDTAMYTRSDGTLYRQGADRQWKRSSEHGWIADHCAWDDTVVVLSSQYKLSTDAGVTWNTAVLSRDFRVMPHSTLAAKLSGFDGKTINVDICEPLENTCLSTTVAVEGNSTGWIVDRGLIAVWPAKLDTFRLSLLYVPELDSATWRREERIIRSTPTEVVGGGMAYLDDTLLIVIAEDGDDTLQLSTDMLLGIANYQLCRSGAAWLLRTMTSENVQFFRSDSGREWQEVLPSVPQLNGSMQGVQANEVILLSFPIGPHRMNVTTGHVARDANGIGHRSEMFTDGRRVVLYGLQTSSELVILEDTPDVARTMIDTILFSTINGVYLIGDSAWVVTDSVFSVDLNTMKWSYEGYQTNYQQAIVAALPGGIGLLHMARVLYRAYGTTEWIRIDTIQSPRFESDALIGTDDGYLVVYSEGYDIDLQRLYSLRFTLEGSLIGESGFIGDRYSWNTFGRRGLRRFGDVHYFTTSHSADAVSTDHGASWRRLDDWYESGLIGVTPTAIWKWYYQSGEHDIAMSSADHGERWSRFLIPDVAPYQVDQLFCLDHHCYAMGEDGVMTIPRPTVGVQEEHTEQPTLLPGDRAVVYNALGEMVAALPVIDGVLAPYDLSILPMQPLWAVSGGVVVRVR